MSTDFGKCWATLQWIDNESKKVIPLIRNKYTFGRTNGKYFYSNIYTKHKFTLIRTSNIYYTIFKNILNRKRF